MFCEQAQQTINAALRIFLQTQFVSSRVIPETLFESQMDSFIRGWQSTTGNRFLRTIQVVRTTTQGNQLMNANINVGLQVDIVSRKATITRATFFNCSCGLYQSCYTAMAIYEFDPYSNNRTLLYQIPKFFIGCFLIEALLASTLECFYNRSCMIGIDKYMYCPLGESFNFSALNASLNSPDQTIESIVNSLMVDSWSTNVSFAAYYNVCTPLSCTWEYSRRNDLFSVITTIIGIFGGLSLALKLFISIALRLTEKMMINGFSHLGLMNFVRNLFICGEEHQMTSRLHFVLVVAILWVLYTFSAFTPQSIIVGINNPSLSTYQDLAKRFHASLQCPCSHISIKYQSFFTMVPRFHQVCSSDFVSNRWITYLYGEGDLTYRFAPTDFLYSASGQFLLLASLCQFSQEAANDSLSQLGNSDFINTKLLSSRFFNENFPTIIDQFQVTMPDLFLSTISLIRETTGANMMISGWSTSWVVVTPPVINNLWTAHTVPLAYEGCSCGLSSKCVQPSRGMFAGCYPLEALFQSTLQCFYDQQCIDPSNTFKAMDMSFSNSGRFDANATIESIVNELMVGEYSSKISYEKYFDQCAPSSCSYSYIDNRNVIAGLTNLIELYGGLVIIFRLIAVIIVRLIRRQTRKISPT